MGDRTMPRLLGNILPIILTVYLQLRSEIIRDNGRWIGSKLCNSDALLYIYTLVILLRLAFPRHTLMFMIGRHELNRVLFLCVPEREIDIQKGMEIQRSPPLFSRTSRDKGGEGGFFVLTFASFQRNEPRGKWKSRTNGVEDNRPWKRPKRPLLSSCRPEYRLFSFLLEEEEEEEGRSVYSPSFSPVEILLYDAATTSAIRIFIRTTLKALT